MKMAEVETLLGAGKQISENLSADGLKTQVVEYTAADRTTAVTYVNGVVVQYAIRSR